MVHTSNHSVEDIILNPEIFKDLSEGNYIHIYENERPRSKLVVKVPLMQTCGKSLEVSLSKVFADAFNMKPFSRVVIEKIKPQEFYVDFVELAFRRQFLQRGNMWRFKEAMVGRPVYIGQNVSVDGVQAQIQELRDNQKQPFLSGVISENTNFIFRSRSARIKWLVQISSEMWEYDQVRYTPISEVSSYLYCLVLQNGDLFFEKFLNKFVDRLFDRWKALSVTHALSVIFFARTIYVSTETPSIHDNASITLDEGIKSDEKLQGKTRKSF